VYESYYKTKDHLRWKEDVAEKAKKKMLKESRLALGSHRNIFEDYHVLSFVQMKQ
jgi:hypothetical protein